MRATISSGSQKASVGSRRTFTLMPLDAMAPSHTSWRFDRKQLTSVSTTPDSALIAETLELGRDVDFREMVELSGRNHFDGDLHAQLVLEGVAHVLGDRRVLRRVGLAHNRQDELVA